MSADKVKFGIKNCHIFPITSVSGGVPTYGPVIDVPGAVSFSLGAQGDINKFYADNVVYYQSASNNGYEGDLELALIPEAVFEKIFKYAKDANGVVTESANVELASFAMTFEESGDQTGTKFVLYIYTATRPTRNLNTIEDSKTPTTQTLTVSAIPLADGSVMAMSTSTTPEATLNTWHQSVYFASSTADYLVEFNSMGGSPVPSQTVANGGKATEPADPTKSTYTFGGWYSDLDLTDAWTFSTDTVTSDLMLYAKWS
jgi:phi13 family phage major tail protein